MMNHSADREDTFNLFHLIPEEYVQLNPMTRDEYHEGGRDLDIYYNIYSSPVGEILMGSTHKGLVYLGFVDVKVIEVLTDLIRRFPHAQFERSSDPFQLQALSIFQNDWTKKPNIKLRVHGTRFQLKVWNELLRIPPGQCISYGELAKRMGAPGASRAVGTAIGANPIALLIPCHRVIRADGSVGNYHWGKEQKLALLEWEKEKSSQKSPQ